MIRWLYIIWVSFQISSVPEQVETATEPLSVCMSEMAQGQHAQDDGYQDRRARIEAQYQSDMDKSSEASKSHKKQAPNFRFTDVSIPVVIYLVHQSGDLSGSITHPDDARILSGLSLINQALDGLSICDQAGSGLSTDMELCLATQDIQGRSTSGILRYDNPLHTMDVCTEDAELKNLPRQVEDNFPTSDYLNIYIVRDICASCQAVDCLAGGYATYPPAHGTPTDGLVIEASSWDGPDCDKVKSIMHEIGHYFNLYHTFEGGCINGDCLIDGDRVCDTPPDQDQNYYPSNPCTSGQTINSCSTDVQSTDINNPFSTDQDDLTSNYMDYSPPICKTSFTAGQVARMRSALEGPRQSLLLSAGCTEPLCLAPITIDIDVIPEIVEVGSSLLIVNRSTGATNFMWSISDGSQVDELTTTDLSWTWTEPGNITVCLQASNASVDCTQEVCFEVTVNCTISPTFTTSATIGDIGDVITMTNTTGDNSLTFTWLIDGIAVGSGDTYNYMLVDQGHHVVELQGCNIACCITSSATYLQSGACRSGREANHWIFGNDGVHLDFNSGQVIEQAALDFRSSEPTAIAIDAAGNLLFYSNGIQVYNRNHESIFTPLDDQLSGNSSSTHSIALPWPESDSLWYIFYPQGINSGDLDRDSTSELYYSVMDMSLNSGLGDITVEDEILFKPTTEKVAAVRHCNDADWWLVGHEAGSNRFFTWLLNKDGIQPPVVSSTGASWQFHGSKAGQMKISADGTRLATVTGRDFIRDTIGHIELFDFNKATGIVESVLQFKQTMIPHYGLEFSPNSDFLYISNREDNPRSEEITQYDMRFSDPQDIINSAASLGQLDRWGDYSAFLTAPDGKIYISDLGKSYLHVIHEPNRKGETCNFEFAGLPLLNGRTFLGLPTFPADVHAPYKPWLVGPNQVCDTLDELRYYVTGNCAYQVYDWHIIGTSEILRTDGDTIWVRPGSAGLDQLIVTKQTACATVADTMEMEIVACDENYPLCDYNIVLSEADTTICTGETAWFQWSGDIDHLSYRLASVGNYNPVRNSVVSFEGLSQSATVEFNYAPASDCDTTWSHVITVHPALDVIINRMDSVVCRGDTAYLDLTTTADLVEVLNDQETLIWTNPTWPLVIGPIQMDSCYFIRVRDQALGCDTIIDWCIHIDDNSPELIDTLYICVGDSLFILDQVWISSPMDAPLLEHHVLPGCDSVYGVQVLMYPEMSHDLTFDPVCLGHRGAIYVATSGGSGDITYRWYLNTTSPGLLMLDSTESQITDVIPGLYLVVISDDHCTDSLSIDLAQIQELQYTVSSDHQSCYGLDYGAIYVTSDSIFEISLDGVDYMSLDRMLDLSPDIYAVYLRDQYGCIYMESITIDAAPAPDFAMVLTHPDCDGSTTSGSAGIISNDGNVYEFSIDTMLGWYAFKDELVPQKYHTWIRDFNGCIFKDSFNILNNTPVDFNYEIISEACINENNGIIIFNAPLNTLIYNELNQLITVDTIIDLSPDIYIYYVENTACRDTVSIEVSAATPLTYDIEVQHQRCPGEPDGFISILSDSPVETSLDGEIFSTDTMLSGLTPNMYTVYIRDLQGCTYQEEVLIDFAPEADYTLVVNSPNCDNMETTGSVSILSEDGRSYEFSQDTTQGWSTVQTQLIPEQYYIWVRYEPESDVSCLFQDSFIIVDAMTIDVNYDIQDESCAGASDGMVVFSAAADLIILDQGSATLSSDTVTGLSPDVYTYYLEDQSRMCLDTLYISIEEGETLELSPIDDLVILPGEIAVLQADASYSGDVNELTYAWSPTTGLSCADCLQTVVETTISQAYTLTVTSPAGCQETVTFEVSVIDPADQLFVPNSFTPNYDGINDMFRLYTGLNNIDDMSMVIFNRWGDKIFNCAGSIDNCAWSGFSQSQKSPTGVYIYTLELTYRDGSIEKLSGDLTLIR